MVDESFSTVRGMAPGLGILHRDNSIYIVIFLQENALGLFTLAVTVAAHSFHTKHQHVHIKTDARTFLHHDSESSSLLRLPPMSFSPFTFIFFG